MINKIDHERWESIRGRMEEIVRNTSPIMTPENLARITAIQAQVSRMTFSPEILGRMEAVRKSAALSLEAARSFDGLRQSIEASLSLSSEKLVALTGTAQGFRDEMGAELFDSFAAEGQERQVLGDALSSTNSWQALPEESRRSLEWLLAGLIWIVVLCSVVGIKVDHPTIEAILDDVGISALDIANFAAAARPLSKWYRRSHPIDKKIKRYVQG